MNDFFYEQILPVKSNLKKQLLRVLVIILTMWGFAFLLFAGGILGMTLGISLVYLVFFRLLPKFRLEYEYSLTNNHFEISAIYNKESRKEKYSLDLQKAEIIAPLDSPRLQSYGRCHVHSFISTDADLQIFSIILKQDKVFHSILIQPNDTMKESMKRRVPSRMYFD